MLIKLQGDIGTFFHKFRQTDTQDFLQIIASKYLSVDVICENIGGKALSCSDEWFGPVSNLIKITAPLRDPSKFTDAGAWYDGWETRRHNKNPYDWAIFRMGVFRAKILCCEVDTTFFNGNHAPFISIEGLYDTSNNENDIKENDPRWMEVIKKKMCGASRRFFFFRDNFRDNLFTHVKLKMYPDGGIARFRVYGQVDPPPFIQRWANNYIDLVSVCNGGIVLKASDQHFSPASNLLLPGRGHDMSDGWETRRSRIPGHNDWAIIKLGRRSDYISKIVVDTAYYKGNYPKYICIYGIEFNGRTISKLDDSKWDLLVENSKPCPDVENIYMINKHLVITHIKLIMIPDGGIKRIRVWGC